MRLNFPLIKRNMLRLLKGRHVNLYSLAVDTRILCPEETVSIASAYYPPGALEKITGRSPWRDPRENWKQDQLLIEGGEKQFPATCAHVFKDVDIVRDYLYRGPAKDRRGAGSEQWFLKDISTSVELEQANLVTSFAGALFFGPVLRDDFLFELNAVDPRQNIKTLTRPYHHEQRYRELLDLDQTSLVEYGHVKELTLYSQPEINSLRTKQYTELRKRLRSNVGVDSAVSKTGVYLKRGRSGEQRVLSNEQAIEDYLTGIGFDIVEPSALTVDEIVKKTLNANIVVSVEGSHKAHMLMTIADQGAFVVLQPPDRFSMVFKEFVDCMGMKFAFIVGDTTNDGFNIDLNQLKEMIQQVG